MAATSSPQQTNVMHDGRVPLPAAITPWERPQETPVQYTNMKDSGG